MRRIAVIALSLLATVPLAAQNTDIESMSGLQFNFGNPGARALGMGGAFLGLADDASAAEANPAGLTILRKAEISIEGRNYLEQQLLTTSGTFPDLEQTAFKHYSKRVELAFASVVYPIKGFTLGAYYHQPLKNVGAGQVVPVRNEFTGRIEKDVPTFFLPRNGTPVSQTECNRLVQQQNDPFACLQYTLNPFITAVDVQQQTFGLAGAYQFGKVSVGATARYQTYSQSSFTYRVTPTFDFSSISLQTTADVNGSDLEMKKESDVTFSAGFKYAPTDRISVGGVYKQGAEFVVPTYIAAQSTGFEFVKLADTTFHVPDVMGLGVSIRPIPVLTVNVDAVRVNYSNLVDDFVATNADVRDVENAFYAPDVTEIHVGAEYFFSTKVPFALRAGYWRDPAHATEYRGPLNQPDLVAEAVLYPKGKGANHFSVGAGLAWPRFQIDLAYDTSDNYKVGSVSMVTRF